MRVAQVWQWIYHRGARDFADDDATSPATCAPGSPRRYTLDRPEIVARQVSADGTRKYLLRVAGGGEIETVYIPETDRGTLCVSSQIGCTLTCSFCHTGTQRLVRNLTAAEIVGQILVARDDLGDWGRAVPDKRLVSNVVLMGMGEPLYNFEAVRDAMKIAMDGAGLALSRRRITLSTSGRRPRDRPRRRRDRLPARHLVPRHHRPGARRAGADQPQVEHRRAARRLPGLSAAVERRANHLRVRDAEGRERQRRRREAAGAS